MPIYFSSSGYGYTYRKEKNRNYNYKKGKGLFKFFTLFLLIIAIIFFVGYLIFQLTKNEITSEKKVFALKVAGSSNYENSLKIAQTIQSQGGAGYVHIKSGENEIYVSCYKTKLDAEKVLNNLNENGYQFEIIEIAFKYPNLNKNLNKEQKENIKDMCNLFYDTYSQLYDLSILVDTNEITKKDYTNEITNLYQSLKTKIASFNTNFIKVDNAQIIYLRIYLNNLVDAVKNLQNENNISSQIKICYFEVIFLHEQLLQNI